MLFYDGQLEPLLTKRVRNSARQDILEVLIAALKLRAQVPNDPFHLDRAKAEVMAVTDV